MLLDRITKDLSEAAKAFQLRGLRAEVLASNIANADTPKFKAKDFDFRVALARATQVSRMEMTRTDRAHYSVEASSSAAPKMMFRTPNQMSIDGNTVEVDIEIAKFSENAIRYQAAMTFLNEEIQHIRSAIQE